MTSTAISDPLATPGRRGIAWGLSLFIWLLPFHILVMAWLFGGLELPGPVVRFVAAWKEGLIAALLAAAVFRVALRGGIRCPIVWLDLAVAGLVLVALAYLLGGGVWFGFDLSVVGRLYGLRDAVYFSLLYFVGRATPEVVRDERVLKALFLVGVVTSVVAVVERLFVTPEMLVLLGTAQYFQEFLGVAPFTAGNAYGLPTNYWVMIGSHLVQRAGSTYMSSQGFAIPFLIIMPAATVWVTARRRATSAWLGYGIVWLGLLLTITRLTIVACLLQALAIAALRRRWGLVTGVGAVVILAFGCALLVVPGLATYIGETLTWQSASSVSHLTDWIEGMENALRYPFGAGLGMADQTAVRFGLDPLAGDNLYLKYAVELGVVGLGLYLATIAGAVLNGAKCGRDGIGVQADYGIVVAAAALGILLNALTAAVFNAMPLTYEFFWLLGSVTSAGAMITGQMAAGPAMSGATSSRA